MDWHPILQRGGEGGGLEEYSYSDPSTCMSRVLDS